MDTKKVLVKNFTNVKYNHRLIEFLKKMKKDLDYCFDILEEDYDIKTLGNTQSTIRKYIERHRQDIDFITENQPIYKPDYFALLIAVSSDFENNSSYDKCLSEFHNNILEREFDCEIDDKTKCICGKDIHCLNAYIVTSSKTNLKLVLCCECIEKNKILTTETMAQYVKRRKFGIFKNNLYKYGVNKEEIELWSYCGGNKTGMKEYQKLYDETPKFEICEECVCGKDISNQENHYVSKDNEYFLIICKDCKKNFKKNKVEMAKNCSLLLSNTMI